MSSPDLLPPWELRLELGSYPENDSQTWPTARDHAQKQPRQIRRDFQESIGDTRSSISGGNFSPARTPASQPPQKIAQSIQRMEGRGEAPSQPDVEEHLPLQAEVFRLTDLFFAKHHLHLPCLHRKRVLNHIENNLESTGDSGLVLVIIAVAASTHQEIDVRARGQRWLARARGLLERELDRCSPYVSTMQVSVWIVFLLYVTGEHLQAWMLLSRIYHLASAMGYNQIDRPGNSINLPSVGTDLEREEFRKALWALYILDRSISCLLFVPLVIDDRYLFVNFPVQEEYFQSHSDANVSCPLVDRFFDWIQSSRYQFDSLDCSCSPFTTDLSVLIGPYILQNPGSMPNVGHIYRASVLLGRIVDLHKQPHVPRHSREHIEHISNLERILSLFDFALSKPNQCSHAMEPSAVLFSLWLSTLVQTCNILLWHPHASSAQPTSKDIGTYHNGHPPRERCSVAAKSILRDLRARQAHLLASSNPFLLCACFLSCHLTVIGSHYEEKNCRDDVEFLLDMVKRMGMNGYLLGQKLHRKMNSDVRRKPEEMQDLANGCGYYIDHRHSPSPPGRIEPGPPR